MTKKNYNDARELLQKICRFYLEFFGKVYEKIAIYKSQGLIMQSNINIHFPLSKRKLNKLNKA